MRRTLVGGVIVAVAISLTAVLWPVVPIAHEDWVMGDLSLVATALGVQPTTEGKYDVSEILCALLEVMGGNPGCATCEACLARINSATKSDFMAVNQIGEVRASSLVAAQPFEVSSCSVYSIEAVLDAVPDIGPVLCERVVRHFCPELYED
jgi:hypothetical protein